MERLLAGRSLIGRIGLSSPRGGTSRGSARSPSGPAALARPLAPLRALASLVWQRRWLRLTALGLLVATALLAGAYLGLRHTPLTAVRHVRVVGARGGEASAIDAALVSAAQGMSTLDVHTGALRAAVARFPLVREVSAVASFPHSLRVVVHEQPPVAALLVAGTRTAVAADGVVLGPRLLSSSLPTLSAYSAPELGKRISRPNIRAALVVLGAAPKPLESRISRAYSGPEGLTVVMANGLLVYFGDGSLPHAKWLSLVRVLADPSSAGASYVDVRLPGRPAAGFPAGVSPPRAATEGEEGAPLELSGPSESTVATLAEHLSAATPGVAGAGTAAAAPTPAPTPSEEPAAPEAAEAAPGPAEPAAAAPAAAAPGGEAPGGGTSSGG